MNSRSVLERHAQLYFADGDVVLAVKQTPESAAPEDPPKYTLFRVHKFLLKHHSATFTNLFTDSTAASAEVYDGVPLAEMHGDKAEDFTLLLSYLYNPSSLLFNRHDPDTPLTVRGVIKLADKYLIEPLHRCLVQQVCSDWPATLNEYDVQQAEIDALQKLDSPSCYGIAPDGEHRGLADVVPEPASAILFAREFGCSQILPAAFYRLSLIPAENHWGQDSYRSLAARWSLLNKEDLLRYIRGCQYLHEYRPEVTAFLCDDCADQDDGPCYEFVARLIQVIWDQQPSPTHPDPLRLLAKCADYDKMPQLSKKHFPYGLCATCRMVFAEELQEERNILWNHLSTAFKLE